MSESPSFKTRARVLNQLGEQLIKNEAIALLELIKNSYDADASQCAVTMLQPHSRDDGKIIIEDDGEGMDYQTLSIAWLEIGTSYKGDLRADALQRRSPKFKRLRLGEKGIGRLGVHRLGRGIEVVTRRCGFKECVLLIDWDKIAESRYIEDIPVSVFEREPEVFVGKSTGTRITIDRLKAAWTRRTARECARSILSLNSPFESNDSFSVVFDVQGVDWLNGLLTFSDIEQYRLFSFDISMAGNSITNFDYKFLPWDTMTKLSPREVTQDDTRISSLLRMQYKDGKDYRDIDLGKYEIGGVRFKGVIFDRDTRTLDLGVQDKAGLKKYLDRNGGIRVFRDNMRVLDYGEPGNDWLDLGGRRINMPTKRISNNIVLGAVYLDRDTSDDLVEKANREGFVENGAYLQLCEAVRFAMDRVETLRQHDKDLLRMHYSPKATAEPVVTSITELKDVIEKNVNSEAVRNDIYRYLDRIEVEYDTITDSLMRSAGAGLNLIVVVHQVEKIIKEIREMLRMRVDARILEERVQVLSSLVEGYSILIRRSEKKPRNLAKLVEQCVFNMGFRLDAHEITLEPAFRNRAETLEAICSEDHVLNALMNLFDNSIWWLGYSRAQDPTIFVDISDELPGYASIVVADNGPGFTMPTDEVIRPFVSNKPGGMGIGLHLTHQIMESLDGELVFPEADDFNIPAKYEKGAKIALAFKRGDR